MRKKWPRVFLISAALLIAGCAALLAGFPVLRSRLALHHYRMNVSLTIDGDPASLDGQAIFHGGILTFFRHSGERKTTGEVLDTLLAYEKKKIRKGACKFSGGSYGDNMFFLALPQEEYAILEGQDIMIVFGKFNPNWWHVYDLRLEIAAATNESGEREVTVTQRYIYTEDGYVFEHTGTTAVSETYTVCLEYLGP